MKVEALAAASVVALYAAAVLLFFPEYGSQVLPLIDSGYLQERLPVSILVRLPAFLLFVIAGGLTLFVERRHLRSSGAMFPLVAAGGFALAMLVQGKGYANHLYPAVALSLIGLGYATSGHSEDPIETRLGLVVLTLAGAAGAFLLAQARTYPEVAEIVEHRAPAHPTLLVAGTNLSIGDPLTRWVGGRWVGTRGSLWVTGTARDLLRNEKDPAERTRLEAAIAQDRRIWVADLDRSTPDVVLVDGAEGWRWINRNPDVRAGMAPYHVAGTADGIIVMIRPRRRRTLLTRGG
jgi:protein-S-isoprenylcysteine O-methyltransferase Ste14